MSGELVPKIDVLELLIQFLKEHEDEMDRLQDELGYYLQEVKNLEARMRETLARCEKCVG